MPIVIAVLLFGAILLVHEFGHFIAARKCGVFVEEFAIGMGPKLLSKQGKETLYSLRLLPIGGFCKMRGEDETNDDPRSLNSKPVYQRAIIMVAGATMNFVLAFVAVLAVSSIGGITALTVSGVVENTPAAAAGILPGDRIMSIGGKNVHLYDEMMFNLTEIVKDKQTSIVVNRDGKAIKLQLTPMFDKEDSTYKIGVQLTPKAGIINSRGLPRANPWEHIENAVFSNIFYVKSTLYGIGQLITLKVPADAMAGPVGVTSVISDVYQQAAPKGLTIVLLNVFHILALLSANVGVFNLLPLPALDGGRVVFLLIELVRRKPIKREAEGMVHFVGFALLMVLTVFILYSDIMKLAIKIAGGG